MFGGMLKFLKSTVLGQSLIISVVICISICLLFEYFNEDWVEEDYEVQCFEELEVGIHQDSSSAVLEEYITCFEWDSIVLLGFGTYEDYLHLNFKKIRTNLEYESGGLDWLDGDRQWSYIYFYNEGQLLNDAIAVPSLYLHHRLILPKSIPKPIF
jgi:hypothetical protein